VDFLGRDFLQQPCRKAAQKLSRTRWSDYICDLD